MQICSPESPATSRSIEFSPRPSSLQGLRIGLLDNQKAPVDRILKHLEQRLQQRFPGVSFVSTAKKSTGHPASPDVIRTLTAGCDVVINALGD